MSANEPTVGQIIERVNRIPGGRAVLTAIAEELGVHLHFCELPICGRPFIKKYPKERFCSNSTCRHTFHNKFGRQ
jgi:hypothetical protein